MSPQRIQRQRVKGWRMPEGAIYVGRGSKFGNPFKVGGQIHLVGKRAGQRTNAADVVGLYRAHLLAQPAAIAVVREELPGKTLACWCKVGEPCHADVLLAVANEVTP